MDSKHSSLYKGLPGTRCAILNEKTGDSPSIPQKDNTIILDFIKKNYGVTLTNPEDFVKIISPKTFYAETLFSRENIPPNIDDLSDNQLATIAYPKDFAKIKRIKPSKSPRDYGKEIFFPFYDILLQDRPDAIYVTPFILRYILPEDFQWISSHLGLPLEITQEVIRNATLEGEKWFEKISPKYVTAKEPLPVIVFEWEKGLGKDDPEFSSEYRSYYKGLLDGPSGYYELFMHPLQEHFIITTYDSGKKFGPEVLLQNYLGHEMIAPDFAQFINKWYYGDEEVTEEEYRKLVTQNITEPTGLLPDLSKLVTGYTL